MYKAVFLLTFLSQFLAFHASWAITLKEVFGKDPAKGTPRVLIDIEQNSWRSFSFTAEARGFRDGEIDYLWDFGDGQISNIANPTNIFRKPGSYTVRLSALEKTTGETISAEPHKINISFYNLGNYLLWIWAAVIILTGTALTRLTLVAGYRHLRKFESLNKRSEHPILIRKKRNPPKF